MKIKEEYKNISKERFLELKEMLQVKGVTNIGFIQSTFRIENQYCSWLNSILRKKKDTPYDFIPRNDFHGAKTAKIEQIYMMLQSNAIQNDKNIVCPSLEVIALVTGTTVQWVTKVQKRLIKKGLLFFYRKAKNSLKYFSIKINQLKNLLSVAKEKLKATTENKVSLFRQYFKQFSHSLNRFMKVSQIKNDNYIDYVFSEYNFLNKEDDKVYVKKNNTKIDFPDIDL